MLRWRAAIREDLHVEIGSIAMQILRHSRIAVTMEIYTEATSEGTRAALRKLGDILGARDGEDNEGR